MSYQLMGSILEVCECKVLCPCWIGEDPDNGVCRSALAYHYDQGMVERFGAEAASHNGD